MVNLFPTQFFPFLQSKIGISVPLQFIVAGSAGGASTFRGCQAFPDFTRLRCHSLVVHRLLILYYELCERNLLKILSMVLANLLDGVIPYIRNIQEA